MVTALLKGAQSHWPTSLWAWQRHSHPAQDYPRDPPPRSIAQFLTVRCGHFPSSGQRAMNVT